MSVNIDKSSNKSSSKQINPSFIPDYNQSSNRVYSNYISVSHSGLDFTLTFLDVSPPTKDEVELAKQNKDIPTPVQCEVVIPNEVVPNLIKALEEQLTRYEKNINGSKENK